jgi:hypothetical protein
LPWPFHAVLKSTVSSRPIRKKTAVFGLYPTVEPAEQAVRRRSGESDEGRASTTGERIQDAGDRREQCCADVKALKGSAR